MAKIGIIGAGTWGIALSVLLHDNGHKISVWSALPQEIKDLQEKHEHKNLPGVVLPEDMEFTADLGHAMGPEGSSGIGSSLYFYQKYCSCHESFL